MTSISKHIIDEYKNDTEMIKFFGFPIAELDRDELLALIGCLSKQLKDSNERAAHYLDMLRTATHSHYA